MLDSSEKRKQLSRWVIRTVTGCVLIFLFFRHIDKVAFAVRWTLDMFSPIWIGVVMAMILNVPMALIEGQLGKRGSGSAGRRRVLSILLALLLVFGLFVGIAFLVLPELLGAVQTIVRIASDGDFWNNGGSAFTAVLDRLGVDWLAMEGRLRGWLSGLPDLLMNSAGGLVESLVGKVVTLFVSFVFSIYVLANKEMLKGHTIRLVRAWLPEKASTLLLHSAAICNENLKSFVTGQATSAILLGLLCFIGMLILRIPFAPMVGALIGVTALIPLLGAIVGALIAAVIIFTESPVKALIFLVFLVILQQFEENAIYPRVVGAKINLAPIWVLAAVTVGGNLGGPVGMFFGVPAAASIYTLLREATLKREQGKTT